MLVKFRDKQGLHQLLSAYGQNALLALLIPPFLFFAFRPETFGLLPNPLDPVFYTGYAINFSNVILASGQEHYFVSRWTAYLPTRWLSELIGIDAARLAVRWAWSTLIAAVILNFSPLKRWSVRLAVTIAVLIMPMYARPLFTDYTESTFVPAITLVLLLSLWGPLRLWVHSAIGVLAAIASIANPVAVLYLGPPVMLYLHRNYQEKSTGKAALAILTSSISVALAGLLYFRAQYDLPNIYAPTLLAVTRGFPRDPLLSPTTEWLLYYSWVYIPPFLLLIVTLLLGARRAKSITRPAPIPHYAMLTLTAMVTLQWVNQLVRGGGSLELSYYWSPSYAVVVALLIVVVALASDREMHHALVSLALLGATSLILSSAELQVVPGGIALPVTVGLLAIGLVAIKHILPGAAVTATFAVTAALQVWAPQYAPSHGFDPSPRYDAVLFMRSQDDISAAVFEDIKWLTDAMQQVENSHLAGFCFVGSGWLGYASVVGAVYVPHVTGSVLDCGSGALSDSGVALVESGRFSAVSILGNALNVDSVLEQLLTNVPEAHLVRRESLSPGLGFSLAVVDVPSLRNLPFTFTSRSLYRQTGRVIGDGVSGAAGMDSSGFLAFGPYVPLEASSYALSVSYMSDASTDQTIGFIDVVSGAGSKVHGSVSLMGTDGKWAEVVVAFEMPQVTPLVEFRVFWNGLGEIEVWDLVLASSG